MISGDWEAAAFGRGDSVPDGQRRLVRLARFRAIQQVEKVRCRISGRRALTKRIGGLCMLSRLRGRSRLSCLVSFVSSPSHQSSQKPGRVGPSWCRLMDAGQAVTNTELGRSSPGETEAAAAAAAAVIAADAQIAVAAGSSS